MNLEIESERSPKSPSQRLKFLDADKEVDGLSGLCGEVG